MDSVGRVLSDPADSNELSAGWLLALSLRAGTAATTLELSTLVVRRLRVQAEAVNLVDVDLLIPDAVVVDNGHRVVLLALVHRVDARGQHVAVLRHPRRLGDLRLAGKIDLEAVLRADELVPFLRGRSASDRQRDCEHDCRHAHGVSYRPAPGFWLPPPAPWPR